MGVTGPINGEMVAGVVVLIPYCDMCVNDVTLCYRSYMMASITYIDIFFFNSFARNIAKLYHLYDCHSPKANICSFCATGDILKWWGIYVSQQQKT